MIEPLASETLGVRSMAVKIGAVVIDPSASLAPRRFGLPPHPKEWEALLEASKRIVHALEKAEIVVITHYHRDHYNPGWLYDNSILDSKKLLIKDYKNKINVSQKIRAYKFLKSISHLNVDVQVADGKEFEFGDLKLTFSEPLPHGKDLALGYVLSVKVNDVLFSSDVQGGPLEEHRWIALQGADVILLDGPPLYLRGFELTTERAFIDSLKGRVIIDHHSARSEGWRDVLNVKEAYNDLLGVPENLLEAKRKELYEEYPVEEKWLKMKYREMRELFFPSNKG